MVLVNSTTKGLAAMTIAVANSRGWIDYEAPVAEYWPEFAQNGKAAITVRQLLSHEAGLVWIDEPLHFEDLSDLDSRLARARAAEAGMGAGNATRLPRDDDRALHAGADPPRRPGAPHARPLLPRGDRDAARDRVLHRPAAGDSRRAARAAEAVLTRARASAALPTVPTGYVIADPVAVVAAAKVDALRRRRPERPPLARGRGSGGQRRRDGACDRAGLFGVRGGRSGARHHPGDAREPHGGPRRRASEGRGDGRAELAFARLPQTGTRPQLRFESSAPSVRQAPAARSASPTLTRGSASPT